MRRVVGWNKWVPFDTVGRDTKEVGVTWKMYENMDRMGGIRNR